jgi:hypothetical protein
MVKYHMLLKSMSPSVTEVRTTNTTPINTTPVNVVVEVEETKVQKKLSMFDKVASVYKSKMQKLID